MALLEVHIRKPPCAHCTDGWVYPNVFGLSDEKVVCIRCLGRSGIVEYSMFVSSDHGMVGRWLDWPTEDQTRILARHARTQWQMKGTGDRP